MESTTTFFRTSLGQRGSKTIIIGGNDSFPEVKAKRLSFNDSESFGGAQFDSVHHLTGTMNQTIMTAYRTEQYKDLLYIVWRDLPYYHHIELGGDYMLQEIKQNGIKNLLIDNTYVQSGWMNDKIAEYFDRAWYPGLIDLGLKAFAHIPAMSTLGEKSFRQFKSDVQQYLSTMASSRSKEGFKYIPVDPKAMLSRKAHLEIALKELY
jgi:hypothetical protein